MLAAPPAPKKARKSETKIELVDISDDETDSPFTLYFVSLPDVNVAEKKHLEEVFKVAKKAGLQPERIDSGDLARLTHSDDSFVIPCFRGKLFNEILKKNIKIYGPPFVFECIREGKQLPQTGHPVISNVFERARISFTSVRSWAENRHGTFFEASSLLRISKNSQKMLAAPPAPKKARKSENKIELVDISDDETDSPFTLYFVSLPDVNVTEKKHLEEVFKVAKKAGLQPERIDSEDLARLTYSDDSFVVPCFRGKLFNEILKKNIKIYGPPIVFECIHEGKQLPRPGHPVFSSVFEGARISFTSVEPERKPFFISFVAFDPPLYLAMSSPTTIIPNSIFERKPLYDRQKKALNDKESMEDAEAEVDIDVFPDEESSRCPTPSSPINSSKYTCETNPFFVPIVPPGLVPEFDATIPPPQICGIFITEFEGIDMNNDILCPKKEVTEEKDEYSDYSSMGTSSPPGTPLKYNIESNECYGHYARTKLTVNFIEYDDGQGSICFSSTL
ncbi:hypothetical protein CAEBREN_25993 [Caenorhabditis brenneri]|uniref:Uncharacterized protein n=1 Tax=Caenorhabditis brenneri TaxID=135651 RepID=G0N2B9_CAEBE|nr:hypothetical protein CAEBREN_25993 [Caenorhabditis brenneri]